MKNQEYKVKDLVGSKNPKDITDYIAPGSILITEKPNFQEIKNSKLKWKN